MRRTVGLAKVALALLLAPAFALILAAVFGPASLLAWSLVFIFTVFAWRRLRS